MTIQKSIKIDGDHNFFDTTGMLYKEFPSDFRQIRYFTLLIVQKSPVRLRELNLLEQQISELIKNAVKHGNKLDTRKKVKIWYSFSEDEAHIIVEDEGNGFKEIEKWNDFYCKRTRVIENEKTDVTDLVKFISYRTRKSDDNDGGVALFAALEYWNQGVVFSDRRNKVAVCRKLGESSWGIPLEV